MEVCDTEESTSVPAEPVPAEDITSLEEEELTDVGVDLNDLDSQLEHNLALVFLIMQTILNISESVLQETIQQIGQVFQLSEPLIFL